MNKRLSGERFTGCTWCTSISVSQTPLNLRYRYISRSKSNPYAAREGFRTHIVEALAHRLGKLILHALTLACFCPDSMISDEHISTHILFLHIDTNPERQQQVAVSANVDV